jgi:probable rRNA maturation factor
MTDSPDVVLMVRAEHDGVDVRLAEGLAGLGEDAALALAIETVRRAGVRMPVSVDVLVTDDAVLRRLNRDYRGRDEVTDVLSFPQLEAPLVHAPADQLWGAAADDDAESLQALAARTAALGTLVTHSDEDQGDTANVEGAGPFVTPPELALPLGDIVISREAVARQAATAGHSTIWEMAFLLAHGILHLVGYDDHTEAGYAAMIAHQDAALGAIGLSK